MEDFKRPPKLSPEDKEEIRRHALRPLSEEEITKQEEGTFRIYLENLDMKENDLRDKKILDIGSATDRFGSYLRKNKINESVISLDKRFFRVENKAEEKGDKKLVKGRAETLPFPDETFDLVIASAVLQGIHLGEKDGFDPEKTLGDIFEEAARVCKPNGEIRFGPVFPLNQKISEVLNNFRNSRPDLEIEVSQLSGRSSNFSVVIIRKSPR